MPKVSTIMNPATRAPMAFPALPRVSSASTICCGVRPNVTLWSAAFSIMNEMHITTLTMAHTHSTMPTDKCSLWSRIKPMRPPLPPERLFCVAAARLGRRGPSESGFTCGRHWLFRAVRRVRRYPHSHRMSDAGRFFFGEWRHRSRPYRDLWVWACWMRRDSGRKVREFAATLWPLRGWGCRIHSCRRQEHRLPPGHTPHPWRHLCLHRLR